MHFDPIHNDRAAGVLLAQACGDALGVPYEFQPTLSADDEPRMLGGGLRNYAPGEYSDDTQIAVCIAEAAAQGHNFRSDEVLDGIAERLETWSAASPADVGVQTSTV